MSALPCSCYHLQGVGRGVAAQLRKSDIRRTLSKPEKGPNEFIRVAATGLGPTRKQPTAGPTGPLTLMSFVKHREHDWNVLHPTPTSIERMDGHGSKNGKASLWGEGSSSPEIYCRQDSGVGGGGSDLVVARQRLTLEKRMSQPLDARPVPLHQRLGPRFQVGEVGIGELAAAVHVLDQVQDQSHVSAPMHQFAVTGTCSALLPL